jgi:hypothetical protein
LLAFALHVSKPFQGPLNYSASMKLAMMHDHPAYHPDSIPMLEIGILVY